MSKLILSDSKADKHNLCAQGDRSMKFGI